MSNKTRPQTNLEQITEDILSGKASLINMIPYESEDYIRCVGKYVEVLEGRRRLAFVRCPDCREYISIYHDEISSNGKTKIKKCLCGFRKSLILKKWRTRN